LRLYETARRKAGVEWRIVFAKTEDENVVAGAKPVSPSENASPSDRGSPRSLLKRKFEHESKEHIYVS